jgi:hypothetical protein
MPTNPTEPLAPSPEQEALMTSLRPVIVHVAAAKPADPRGAERALEKAVPALGPVMARVHQLAKQGVTQGWLVPKSGGPKVRYGRLVKDLGGFSVDWVLMEGPAAGHTHPSGEINFGWAWSGKPHFDGHPPGWVVFPPGSHHVPIVTGGEMLLLYFLPGGRVAWDPPPHAPKQ